MQNTLRESRASFPTPRRALVTGVEHAEGHRAARLLAAHGFDVIAHSFSAEDAARIARDITVAGGRATPVVADLTLEREAERLFMGIEHDHGDLDVVVHAAWLPGPDTTAGSLASLHFSDWNRFAHTHLALTFLTLRRAVSCLDSDNRGGSIITVTGLGTEPAGVPTPARAAINGAVEAFTVAAAKDLGTDSIRTAVLRIIPDNEPIDEDTTAPIDFDGALLGLVDGSTDTRSGLIFPTRMRVPVPSH